MASSNLLLAPPEINPKLLRCPSKAMKSFKDLFIEAKVDHTMGYTENNSATFLSTGNACLDFFFHVVPDTPAETLTSRLQKAWSRHPLTTLKLICNLRGVRGTGKSDKEGFYTAALWLHKHHPKTLATNVSSMAEFGYFKDFPEILYLLLEGADVRQIAKRGRTSKADKKARAGLNSTLGRFGRHSKRPRFGNSTNSNKKKKNPPITEERAREIRELRRIETAKKAVDRFNLDPDYRFLHEKISDLFAERLKSDLESLNSGKENNISLAAKWCPSLDSSFDRSTLLCETIARKIFPRDSLPEYY